MKSFSSSRWFLLSLFVMLVDQFSKLWVVHALPFNHTIKILPFFNLYYAINEGAAFSLLSDHPDVALWLFSGVAVLVSIGIVIWITKIPAEKRLLPISLCLILGGALGNLIDRVRLNHVIDFLQLHYQQYYWPVFNVADSAIVIGAALLVIDAIWYQENVNENSTR